MEKALTVQGVESVNSVSIAGLDSESRTVTGEVKITTQDGENVAAQL